MTEFFNVLPPDEARVRWLDQVPHRTSFEGADDLIPRGLRGETILTGEVRSPEDLPAFPRSTVDGYAVRAADTFGAGESLPAYLAVVGEARMGESPTVIVGSGQAALIHTGAMIPQGANAVVMIEHTQEAAPGEIEVLRRVAPGENVLQVGEDVRRGDVVLPAGTRLRPQEIGALLALGLTADLTLRTPPRVAIFATGDEVISPEETPAPGQIRDINSYTVGAMAARAGASADWQGIVPDQPEALLTAMRLALVPPGAADMLVVTAGSSVSARDMTAAVIGQLAAEFGGPGVIAHGVALKPGKPTILAVVGGKPVLGLPGNPVSALVVFWLLGIPAIEHLMDARPAIRPRSRAVLTANVPSAAGREDYVPVTLREDGDTVYADPIFGKSNLIFTLVRADGLLKVPLNATGLKAGEAGDVYFF